MPHGYVARTTPAEFERDRELLHRFTYSMQMPPELEPETEALVDMFAQDFIDFGDGKKPGQYILELYQLDSTRRVA